MLWTSLFNAIAVTGVGLKWVRVNIPQYRAPGDMAQLLCEYELGNDTLYSVKWYKDHEEFYRWVPKAHPRATSYKVEGINVDMHKSNSRRVIIRNVSFQTTGLFRCEVSAEAPSFSSAQSEGRLEVVSLPQEDPTITGEEQQYQINDELHLNCTSGKSRPASILHWYINEQKVPASGGALIHYPLVHHQYGLVSSTLGLRFKLTNKHFLGGSMRVKCVASVQPVLWRGDSQSIVKSPVVRDMREALLLVRSKSNKISSPEPVIFLLVLFYSVLKCTEWKT